MDSLAQKKMFSEVYLLKLNALINDHIEKATAASILFLQILRDDSPDIKKVDQSLVTLYSQIQQVFHIYYNNRAFELLNMAGKRNFGLFLMKVLQREGEGSPLMRDYYERLKTLAKKRNEIGSMVAEKEIGSYSDPIFIIKLNEVNQSSNHNFFDMFFLTLIYLLCINLLRTVNRSFVTTTSSSARRSSIRNLG